MWAKIFLLDYLQTSLFHTRSHAIDDGVRTRLHSELPATGDLTKGYASHDYPDIVRRKRDLSQGISSGRPDITNGRSTYENTYNAISPGDPDISNGRSTYENTYNALPSSAGDSSILFVGGLPSDCTRREVGRILYCIYTYVYLLHYGYLTPSSIDNE